jgi:uncharacterized protein (UPF0333 family)
MEFSWSTFIIVILIIIVIYFLWSMMASSSSSTVISEQQNANTQTTISIPDKSYSFALSAWIYVTDWDSTTGEKVIISSDSDASPSTDPNLLVSLGKDTNVLDVNLGGSTITPIPNIPLQTWVSIILNVNNGSSIDIYINGKLVQTTALKNSWGLNSGSLFVGSKTNGFSGYITMAVFHKAPLGPQDAWDIYSSGYGASGSNSAVDFFNKYKVRFAFVKDNVELSRLDI